MADDSVAGEAVLLEEVVAHPQIPIVARRLLEEESLDRSEGNRKTWALPPDSLEGKHRLVPQKTVVASEGFDQRFDRGGRRNSRQGSGNVEVREWGVGGGGEAPPRFAPRGDHSVPAIAGEPLEPPPRLGAIVLVRA